MVTFTQIFDSKPISIQSQFRYRVHSISLRESKFECMLYPFILYPFILYPFMPYPFMLYPSMKVTTLTDQTPKYDVTIITDDFAGKNTIERHKMVYALLNKFIETGEIHALTIRSLTKDEDEES